MLNEYERTRGGLNMENAVLNVEGMTCRSCENTIENNLKVLNGVDAVKAQSAEGTVNVSFEPGALTLKEITKTIQESGYEVVQQPSESAPKPSCSCCK